MLMTFMGASAAVKNRSELKVDVLYEAFPAAQPALDWVLHLVRLGVAVTFIYAGWNFMLIEIDMDTVTPILLIPSSVVAAMLPVFGIFLALRSIQALVALVRKPKEED